MSKPNDFYPGTNERVCLITGSTDAISTIVQFFNMKIKVGQRRGHSAGYYTSPQSFILFVGSITLGTKIFIGCLIKLSVQPF